MKLKRLLLATTVVCSASMLHTATSRDLEQFIRAFDSWRSGNAAERQNMINFYITLRNDTRRPQWAQMAREHAAGMGIADLDAEIAAPAVRAPAARLAPMPAPAPVAPAPVVAAPVAPAPIIPPAPIVAPVAPTAPVAPALPSRPPRRIPPVAPAPAAPEVPEAPVLAPGTTYVPTRPIYRPSRPSAPVAPVAHAPIEITTGTAPESVVGTGVLAPQEGCEIAIPGATGEKVETARIEGEIPEAPSLSKEEAERYATSKTESPDIGYGARRLKPLPKEKIVIGEEAPVAPSMVAPNVINTINDNITEIKRLLTTHRLFNFTEQSSLAEIKTKIEEVRDALASVQNYVARRNLTDLVEKLESALQARRAKNDNLTQDELNRIINPNAVVMPAPINPEEELPAGIPSAPTLNKEDAERYAVSKTPSPDIGYGARRLKPLPKEKIVIGEEAPGAPHMGAPDIMQDINSTIAEIERQLTASRWLSATERSAHAEIQQLIDAAQKNAENISHYTERNSVLGRLQNLQNALEKRKTLNKALTNEELRAFVSPSSSPSAPVTLPADQTFAAQLTSFPQVRDAIDEFLAKTHFEEDLPQDLVEAGKKVLAILPPHTPEYSELKGMLGL